MIPGELLIDAGQHPINTGRRCITLVVTNAGDRPIQVGSHYHFADVLTRKCMVPRWATECVWPIPN